MFLDKTVERNPKLIEAAFKLHQQGIIEPDTYVIDMDTLSLNAESIKEQGDKYGIKLYFMTKQLGRNPYVAKKLMDIGYEGAVVVDFREAKTMIENHIKIGNVGHLVQIPKGSMKEIISSNPEYVTVYSLEKAQEVSRAAKELGMNQKLMLRVLDKEDCLYSGQYGGFYIEELEEKAKSIEALDNVTVKGITSFPCFLYNEENNEIEPMNNCNTLLKAKKILEKSDIYVEEVNMPSATCVDNIKKIYDMGGTHGEPGHGLMGTTPYSKYNDTKELPAMVYVSEISHNLDDHSYCYGGGHYRRSHVENALVGHSLKNSVKEKVTAPTLESIDYHFNIEENHKVGETVIMSFRAQVFVTRSNVAVVEGISTGNLKLVGIYDALGRKIK